MSSPAVDIYYSLYGTILNAVTAPRGAVGVGVGGGEKGESGSETEKKIK